MATGSLEIHCALRKDFGRGPCCVGTWSGGVGFAERLPLFLKAGLNEGESFGACADGS
jgi:hypothetical protein